MTWFWYQNDRIEILHKMALRKKYSECCIWDISEETYVGYGHNKYKPPFVCWIYFNFDFGSKLNEKKAEWKSLILGSYVDNIEIAFIHLQILKKKFKLFI